jgi:hypothetical protein
MDPITTWIAARVPADRDLTRDETSEVAAALGRERTLWEHMCRFDQDERYFTQLYRDPHLDIWLICWLNGQDTDYHDHDVSIGSVYVVEGMLVESYLRREEDGWIRERVRERPAGEAWSFDASSIHGLRHTGVTGAASIHCYSPALWRMGHYAPGPSGLRREVSTYLDETGVAGIVA